MLKFHAKHPISDAIEVTAALLTSQPVGTEILPDVTTRGTFAIVSTPSGPRRADIGDYIVTTILDKKFPIGPIIFHRLYPDIEI